MADNNVNNNNGELGQIDVEPRAEVNPAALSAPGPNYVIISMPANMNKDKKLKEVFRAAEGALRDAGVGLIRA